MTDTSEIERAAQEIAASEWIGPQPEGDWNRLTLGEQQRYCREACRTKGAIYKTTVSARTIDIKVSLPSDLELRGLTRDEAGGIERYLHRKVEDAIVWVLREREFRKGTSHG